MKTWKETKQLIGPLNNPYTAPNNNKKSFRLQDSNSRKTLAQDYKDKQKQASILEQ